MTHVVAWVLFVAAAVVFWLLAFSVVASATLQWVGLALLATGFVVAYLPAFAPAPPPP